jgi:hypothetical protein
MAKPLLLLDVDGPLIPWDSTDETRPAGFVKQKLRRRRFLRGPRRVWLNPGHGPALVELADQAGAEIVWATGWQHRANRMIGPAIGLPRLPVIEFRDGLERRPGQPFSWKYGPVAQYASGRPLVWLDDDFELHPAERDAFLTAREAAGLPTKLIGISRRTGITDEHLAAVAAWCSSL